MRCNTCEKDWPLFSEQSVAVELYGHCCACEVHYTFSDLLPWTHSRWDKIRRMAQFQRGAHIASNFDQYLTEIQVTHEHTLYG